MVSHPWVFVAVLIGSLAVGVMWPRKRDNNENRGNQQKREKLL